ncbi:MAG: peptidoglycan D,D-transpeptidase FtsI family protein [Sphingosinicella sp.]
MATLAADASRPISSGEAEGLGLIYHRLMLVLLLFAGATALIVAKLGYIQLFVDRADVAVLDDGLPPRADILDRNGITLASTIEAWAIGVHPRRVIGDRDRLARRLHELMPQRSLAEYRSILYSERSFVYLARRAMPQLVARVNALGEPAIDFPREPERLYPQTALAGHVLGWTDREGAGAAGIERALQHRLADPALRGRPLELSLDSRVQAAMESELVTAVSSLGAEGGTGIVLDVRSGEVLALASAPTFNPNAAGRSAPDARYNRATMGVYELGSTFKPITIAAAIEAGVVSGMSQRWDASAPIPIGRFQISDDHPLARSITIPELLVHSSNIATARVAEAMGSQRMQAAFRSLGFHRAPGIELGERARPLWPRYWGRATVLTTGFGHGVAVTPLHLASAYAALVNGGTWRPATLLRVEPGREPQGRRVYSPTTSHHMRQLLRMIVTHGTGRNANVAGYRVGGKTGTAEKVSSAGGYSRSVNVSTFVAAFPMDEPRYVVLVMIDAPRGNAGSHGLTTAAWTAAPVVANVIARAGPMLGVIPDEHRDIDTSELLPLVGDARR